MKVGKIAVKNAIGDISESIGAGMIGWYSKKYINAYTLKLRDR